VSYRWDNDTATTEEEYLRQEVLHCPLRLSVLTGQPSFVHCFGRADKDVICEELEYFPNQA